MPKESLRRVSKYRKWRTDLTCRMKQQDARILQAVLFDDTIYPDDCGLPEDFLCVICFQVLKTTHVCRNGHRCCATCANTWSHSHLEPLVFFNPPCPVCRVRGPLTPAPQVDNELMTQRVKCPYVRTKTGVACQWTGTFGELSGHVHSFPDPPRRQEAAAN